MVRSQRTDSGIVDDLDLNRSDRACCQCVAHCHEQIDLPSPPHQVDVFCDRAHRARCDAIASVR
jgi:hypothetical protein